MYDALSASERRQFATANREAITSALTIDDDVDLSGYSKDELLKALKGADMNDILWGMNVAGVRRSVISSWLERELRS